MSPKVRDALERYRGKGERQGARTDHNPTSGKLSHKSEPERARDKLGSFAGVSGRIAMDIAERGLLKPGGPPANQQVGSLRDRTTYDRSRRGTAARDVEWSLRIGGWTSHFAGYYHLCWSHAARIGLIAQPVLGDLPVLAYPDAVVAQHVVHEP